MTLSLFGHRVREWKERLNARWALCVCAGEHSSLCLTLTVCVCVCVCVCVFVCVCDSVLGPSTRTWSVESSSHRSTSSGHCVPRFVCVYLVCMG